MTIDSPPNPACSLEAHAFKERVKWIAALNQQFLRSVSRRGPTLTLVYDPGALQQVEEMVTRERDCCAFLAFDLQPGENVELTITVPAQAAGDADQLLASFYQEQTAAGAEACCGTCETTVRPARAGGAAGAAVTTSAAAVVACGACCVIPLAFPAVTATVAGGVLAWLGKAHVWMTGFAVLVVVAWLWIWRQRVKRGTRASKAALGLMGIASLVALLAVAWPQIEPSLIAALSR
ncbi:MAG: hypothetical protein J0H95_05125 [Xanthomonadales bacterium]|nr:hypothetical protein [Xanthomonadales bacterium]MBN8794817.1 hypothetical protein [Stenotrophomonas nitritireducens]